MKRLVLLAVTLVACGCGDSVNKTGSSKDAKYEGDYPIQAITTVGMVGDIVRNVGGKHVSVQQIMGPGVDPHLYKPTRDDVQAIMDSDVVFYCGLMLEGKMSDTLVKFGRKKPVYAVTELVDVSVLLEPEDLAGHYDPHLWMDVQAWSQCVDAVSNALVEFDPEHADEYRANAESYRNQLKQLHEYGKKCLASVPVERRILITSHDAFNYFGRAYDLQVEGVQGISTETEAGIKRNNDLVDLIVNKKVQAVFVESSVPTKSIEALVEGARARGHSIRIGGKLYSDAMGEADTYEGSYIGMLDHNITITTRALGGDAPEKGMQGKLRQSAAADHLP